MFPGCLSNSQLLQDIRDNYRAQTLVSVPGFTAKHHMFVQPLASRHAPPSSTSSREPLSSSSPVSSELRIESAASSTTQSYGAGGTATALFVPSWVTYHGVVLSFRAVRVPVGDDVTVLYHLSDGTYEVKKDGKVFLKRPIGDSSAAVSARVAAEIPPDPCTLEIGDELKLSGHVFRLLDADAFTRRHVEAARNGVPLGPPAKLARAAATDAEASALVPRSKGGNRSESSAGSNRRLTSYLSRGEDLKAALRRGAPAAWRGVVLRVWAVELHEKLDRYLISFHPEDASVELRLIDPKNEAKGSLVLSRTSLVDPLAAMLGESTEPVCRAFQPTDFLVGSHLKLSGRELLVTKMCGSSAAWMSENVEGVSGDRLHGEIPVEAGRRCRKPEPKRDDDLKEAVPLPVGLDVLQFLAVGGGTVGSGQDRFVIRVHCADSSVSIFGAETGSKYLRPGHYGINIAKDLFIGARVTINRQQFEIIDASRATLLYVASHPEIFESSRADDALILRVRESICLDASAGATAVATIEDLAAIETLRGVPKAKLISAAVLLGTGVEKDSSKMH